MAVRLGPWVAAGALLLAMGSSPARAEDSIRALYVEHCARCHHARRVGLTAPPLTPDFLEKRSDAFLEKIIDAGAPATQMPGFSGALSPEQVRGLVAYLRSPAGDLDWTLDDIRASREELEASGPGAGPGRLEEVILVMEKGTRSLAALDGADFSILAKYYVGNVHGGPKFSPSLTHVYSVARDGVLTAFDVTRMAVTARLKAGINSRSLAVSSDGKSIAVANYLPANVVFFDQRLEPVGVIPYEGKAGGFYAMIGERRFVLTFRHRPELWLIDDTPPFAVEKRALPEPFEDLSICPTRPLVIGTKRGGEKLYVYDYRRNEIIAELPSGGLPHLASAAFFRRDGELLVAINHIKKPALTIFSLDRLEKVTEIPLPGAGFFVRTHRATPWLWVDTMTESFTLVSKTDFDDRRELTPRPGRKSMHVEFTTGGRYALVTVPGEDGAVVVYDSSTVEQIKTIPFQMPMGKYNAVNKTYPERAMEPPGAKGVSAMGKRVFDEYCMGCHHQRYEAFGPPFERIASIRSERDIRRHIAYPKASARRLGYKKSSMPVIGLTSDELDAVVSYIMSHKRGG